MEQPEYVRIKYMNIPEEFQQEYNLTNFKHNSWCNFEVVRGAYRLPQLIKLARNLLRTRLNKAGYLL